MMHIIQKKDPHEDQQGRNCQPGQELGIDKAFTQ